MLPPAKKNFPPSRPASARGAKRHPWRRSRSGRTQDTIDAPRQARASGGLGESVKERRRRLETSANASDGQRLRSTLSSQPPPPPKKKHKITPKTIKKKISSIVDHEINPKIVQDFSQLETLEDIAGYVKLREREMKDAARNLEFEKAAIIRDEISQLRKMQRS